MCSIAAALVLALGLGPAPHDPGLSSLRLTPAGERLVVHAAFANADFRGAVALDHDGDGRLDAGELARGDALLRRLAHEHFVLRTATASTGGELVAAVIAENHDVELTLHYQLPRAEAALDVTFLAHMSRGHRCYTALLAPGDAIVADALLDPVAHTFALPASTDAAGFGQAWRFFCLGVEHILIGFDHLAFLLALLVAGITWRRVVATITAFTVAHSVTLLAAASGLVRLPVVLVEATIAASIVVVAIANLVQRRGAPRWPLAFVFGLVHGFGFAGVLADLHIGGPDMLLPLLTFNLGVEVGQLAFACVVVPLLVLAARHARGRHAPALVSVAVAAAGCWWLVERLFL